MSASSGNRPNFKAVMGKTRYTIDDGRNAGYLCLTWCQQVGTMHISCLAAAAPVHHRWWKQCRILMSYLVSTSEHDACLLFGSGRPGTPSMMEAMPSTYVLLGVTKWTRCMSPVWQRGPGTSGHDACFPFGNGAPVQCCPDLHTKWADRLSTSLLNNIIMAKRVRKSRL